MIGSNEEFNESIRKAKERGIVFGTIMGFIVLGLGVWLAWVTRDDMYEPPPDWSTNAASGVSPGFVEEFKEHPLETRTEWKWAVYSDDFKELSMAHNGFIVGNIESALEAIHKDDPMRPHLEALLKFEGTNFKPPRKENGR